MGNTDQIKSNTKIEAGDGSAPDGFSLISNEKLIALYSNLLKFRMAAGMLKDKKTHSYLVRGHEAGIVGVAIDLRSEDAVCSPDGAWLAGLTDRSPMEALLLPSPSGSDRTSASAQLKRQRQPAPHGTLPSNAHAAMGAALASKARNSGQITVVFAGGEAEETWREVLEIAGTHSLPIICVHQENGKRKAATAKRSARARSDSSTEAPWFPSIAVDRDDVVAVHRVANEAIARARQGRGPTLIDCRAFEVQRPDGAHANGNGRSGPDAIATMEQYLRRKRLFHPQLKRDLIEKCTKELNSHLRAERS